MEGWSNHESEHEAQGAQVAAAAAAASGGGKSRRGFAGMDPEKQREIASKGGKAAHDKKRAHEFTADEARAAGKKGGERVSEDRDHMIAIGKKGGERVSRDREWMAKIGRRGGEVVSENREHMTEIGKRGGAAKRTREDA
jgi:uncharacterized protein